jgi:large subunit ribosomal protein L15e
MSMYKAMKKSFATEYKERPTIYKNRLIQWRAEPPVYRVDKPTNIARAREVGYKAKPGVIVVRVKVKGGTKKRVTAGGGRKPSKSGRYFSRSKSLQSIAEERAARKFSNCEVLNSYFVGASGSDKFFEIILLDRASPVIKSDPNYMQVIAQQGRAFRGMTHSGRKHRGLANKGYGTIKRRPSKRSNLRS